MIDLAVVSTATRAEQTWQLASAELADPPPVRSDGRVYVRELPADAGTVVMVGHNPGFEDLATTLSGQPVLMPTSALAVIELAGGWQMAGTGGADLRASGRPPG